VKERPIPSFLQPGLFGFGRGRANTTATVPSEPALVTLSESEIVAGGRGEVWTILQTWYCPLGVTVYVDGQEVGGPTAAPTSSARPRDWTCDHCGAPGEGPGTACQWCGTTSPNSGGVGAGLYVHQVYVGIQVALQTPMPLEAAGSHAHAILLADGSWSPGINVRWDIENRRPAGTRPARVSVVYDCVTVSRSEFRAWGVLP